MTKKKLKFSIYPTVVGDRIKSIRLLHNKTLEEWGKIFGASKGNVLLWEQGKTLPNKKRLEKIAELGNTTINKLLYGNCEEFLDLNFIYYHILYNIPVIEDAFLLVTIASKIGQKAEEEGYTVDELEKLGIFYKDNFETVKNELTNNDKPLHQRLYEIIDKYSSFLAKQSESTQLKNELVDEIIKTIDK